MIKSESQLWELIKEELKRTKKYDAMRVESPMSTGFPDVVFTDGVVNGYIELKIIRKHGAENVIKLDMFSPGQLRFANKFNYCLFGLVIWYQCNYWVGIVPAKLILHAFDEGRKWIDVLPVSDYITYQFTDEITDAIAWIDYMRMMNSNVASKLKEEA